MTTLDDALRYAALGLRVFPLPYKSKVPDLKAWQRVATREEARLTSWFDHGSRNVAVACGRISGVFVLDVDPLKGGDNALNKLIAEHGRLPDTPMQLTGGGGQHYFFKYPENTVVRNSASRLGAGLDIRGEGGYVVVAPSVHPNGNAYEWEGSSDPLEGCAIAAAPSWLLRLLEEREITRGGNGADGAPLVAGERNASLISVAGTMRRRGMSVASIEAALQAENIARCQPKLTAKEVTGIAKSAGRYTPEALKPDAEDVPPLACEHMEDAKPQDIEWLTKGLFAIGKVSAFLGQPGVGKTRVALRLSAAITTGEGFPHGQCCEPGNVLYISIELDLGHTALVFKGAHERFRVLSYAQERSYRRPVYIVRDAERIKDVIREIGGIRLLTIDPIATHMENPNSLKEGHQLISFLEEIMDEFHCSCGFSAHGNKDSGKTSIDRISGSRALTGRPTVCFVLGTDPEDEGIVQIVSNKTRYNKKGEYNFAMNLENFGWVSLAAFDDAEDIIKPPTREEGENRRWLRAALKDGMRQTSELQVQAKAEGMNWATLQRTSTRMGLIKNPDRRIGGKPISWWTLP